MVNFCPILKRPIAAIIPPPPPPACAATGGLTDTASKQCDLTHGVAKTEQFTWAIQACSNAYQGLVNVLPFVNSPPFLVVNFNVSYANPEHLEITVIYDGSVMINPETVINVSIEIFDCCGNLLETKNILKVVFAA